jgi:hypothetical protein
MRQYARVLLALGLGTIVAHCAPRAAGGPVERASSSRMDFITRAEIETRQWANAYDLVVALRPNWLNERGPDSFGTSAELQVHFNGTRAGGVSVLRQMVVSEVEYLEYIDPITATGRWGLGYGHGAIDISTKPK